LLGLGISIWSLASFACTGQTGRCRCAVVYRFATCSWIEVRCEHARPIRNSHLARVGRERRRRLGRRGDAARANRAPKETSPSRCDRSVRMVGSYNIRHPLSRCIHLGLHDSRRATRLVPPGYRRVDRAKSPCSRVTRQLPGPIHDRLSNHLLRRHIGNSGQARCPPAHAVVEVVTTSVDGAVTRRVVYSNAVGSAGGASHSLSVRRRNYSQRLW